MRVFKTKEFARFARREGIGDKTLMDAAKRAERGLVYAKLGGGLIKQKVGARGSYRTIVAWEGSDQCFFVLGFAKSVKADLTPRELETYQKLASLLLGLGEGALKRALAAKEIVELKA